MAGEVFGSLIIPKDPVQQNLEVFRGDDRDIDFTLVDENGKALDLTGHVFTFGVKRSPFTPNLFISKSSVDAAQIEIVNVSTGQVRVHIIPADTQNLVEEFVGLYDIQDTDANGKVRTVLLGRFRVLVDFAP